MDCYSVDSETDPLDFLSPPVKRIHAAYKKGVPFELVNLKNKHLRGLHRTDKSAVPTGIEPSTSLILKKTSPTQFLEQYSALNYKTFGIPQQKSPPQNLSKITGNKPLIKVTVIPRTDQIHNTKLYRKRRHVPKKIQSTSSNQENSIQTKNVYLVVAGRRKEKIYEIRTTGSAEFSNDQVSQNEEAPINDLLNFKQLVQSLNMDKKRKKEKIKNNPYQQTSFHEVIDSTECNFTNTSVRDDVNPNKSKVRIYGQLGLTEDDRYVLRCGASIDNKPIRSEVAQLISDFSAFPIVNDDDSTSVRSISCLADCNKTTSISRNVKDSCVQADFENDCEFQKPLVKKSECKKPSKGSQSTQVNFNIQFASINKAKTAKAPKCVDKKLQCYCSVADEASEDCDDEASEECQNPLVIISVYPKPNSSEVGKSVKTTIENKRSPSPPKASVYNRKIDQAAEKRTVDIIKRESKIPRMYRSPSPTKKVSTTIPQENKPVEARVVRTFREAKSPDRTSAVKKIKDKVQVKEKHFEAMSPKKSRFNTPDVSKPQIFTTKPQVLKNPQGAKKTTVRSHEMGTNTDHLQTKKALVDSYTKKISSRMTKKSNPKNGTSKVKINIDGEREYYDVLFNQGEEATDLTVRRKLKDSGSQESFDEESCASMENLLLLPEMRPRTRSLSLALYDNLSQCGAPLTKHVSRLTIRDSLEISHRREDKAGYGIKNTQTCLINECNNNIKVDTTFLAPIKHYTGDDCSIYDPMARDKEIRQLLGVNKCRPAISGTQQVTAKNNIPTTEDHPSKKSNAFPYHCFRQKNCDKNVVTGNSICANNNMRSNAVQCDKKRTKVFTNTNDNINSEIDVNDATSRYQQLAFKKNVQVFLQVEQFSKQKPIILTRKQYDKVKRTIQKTVSKNINHQKNKYRIPISQVSVGEIKKKKKIDVNFLLSKQVQTEVIDHKSVEEKIEEILEYAIEPKKQKSSSNKKKSSKRDKSKGSKGTKEKFGDAKYKERDRLGARRTMSSVEVHYANVFYKHVTFSSKGNFLSTTSLGAGKSFLTIFRGHKKSPTPNLGTSAYSFYSEDCSETKSIKVLMEPRDSRRRKPFLRRLVSYLVMRSTKGSEPRLNADATKHPPTVNSSVDSYHISSSLAGADLTSSIYDTSASFYSNHTILPVNKIKRGFFSSVRGFLSNRKS